MEEEKQSELRVRRPDPVVPLPRERYAPVLVESVYDTDGPNLDRPVEGTTVDTLVDSVCLSLRAQNGS